MSFHRDRGHPRAQYQYQHDTTRNFAQAVPKAGSDDFGHVHFWLNQTSPQDDVANSQDSFDRDLHHSRSSGWRPYNLPIAPIPLPNRQQRERHLDRDQPIARSPERFDIGSYSAREYEESVAMGSDKENRKRRRSPERQHSPDFPSDDFAFERRPRHKTRPDRYESRKRDDKKARTTKGDVRGARKQTRAKKSRLRSSRDVMDNFTSSFLGNSRITLDTELRVGMSSNARSSAYAGEEIGDLRFNEMRFLEKPEELPKGHRARNSKVVRQEEARNSLDRYIVQHSSSRQSTPAPSTITSRSVGSRRQASRPQEAKSKSQHHGSWRCGSRDMASKTYYDYMLDKSSSLPQRGRSGSIDQAVYIQGSKTSECVPEELIETGVFSGTRFESRLRNRQEYSSTATDTNNYRPGPAETSKQHPHTRSSYEDKGVMVSPGIEKSRRPNQKPPVTLDHNPQGTTAGTPTSMNPSTSGKQPNDVSMLNGDPNPVQVIDNPSTSEALRRVDSRVQATGDEEHQDFTCPVTTQTNKAPRAGKRPKSISETSEGGHHYIRCPSQGLDLGIGPESSLWKDRPTVQPLPQRVSTPRSWEHGMVHPSRYGWQRYQNTPAPPPNLATRYPESLYPRVFTPIPTPHPVRSEPLNYGQEGFITNEKGPGVVRQHKDEETLMEFIQRVESEVMGRWDQPQDSSGVAMGDGNFEDNEIARPASRNSRPLHQQREHSVQGVDWDTHLNPLRRFSGRTATDEDCAAAEAEMRAFWRPNPF